VEKTAQVTANLIGPLALGFRHRDDIEEVTGLLYEMGIGINVVAPLTRRPRTSTRLGAAHVNVLMYPETARPPPLDGADAGHPYTKTVPIGVGATRDFVAEVAEI
jgi:light-independent protochlorophyllide reductase subunit B